MLTPQARKNKFLKKQVTQWTKKEWIVLNNAETLAMGQNHGESG